MQSLPLRGPGAHEPHSLRIITSSTSRPARSGEVHPFGSLGGGRVHADHWIAPGRPGSNRRRRLACLRCPSPPAVAEEYSSSQFL
eukprot:1179014-Prorocentrum_minimum.AAC.1